MAWTVDEGRAARRLDGDALDRALVDAHERAWSVLADLTPGQWAVPYDRGINPPAWEYGHVAWFTELWALREAYWTASDVLVTRAPSRLAGADGWFDSGRVAHVDRWGLALPPVRELRQYMASVLEGVREKLRRGSAEGPYPFRLALFHADMHGEALTYMRQTLDYSMPQGVDSAPSLRAVPAGAAVLTDAAGAAHRSDRDAELPAGDFLLGSDRGDAFVFDNEKWAHEVKLRAFSISRALVSNAEYAFFVDAGGYRDRRLWTDEGWAWQAEVGLDHPSRWRKVRGADATGRGDTGSWEQRWFGCWVPVDPRAPVCHVSAHEAEAYCRFAGRRLPAEAEWERAAIDGAIAWGGSVWEWTSDPFLPYPGFAPDRYRDYSKPWFATHRSVRGGSFATVSRMHHPRYRNYYTPGRNDIFVGFRTCALQG